MNPTKVVITGGAGFLGRRLARTLLERGTLADAAGRQQPIERITLVDVVAPSGFDDPRIDTVVGDIADAALLARAVDASTTSIFHLAAIVSGMAEADFELGMRVNVDASRTLLDLCRAGGRMPRFVFASSVAVYGGELPAVVGDNLAVVPQTSYGTEKAIVELLVNDYSRRGFVDGRVLRLPTICVRPGRPNAAASSFASGIVREPLNGEAANCPVEAATRLWLLSPANAIACLIALHDADAAALGANRIVNGPGLSVSVSEMIAALERIAGTDVVARITYDRDPRIARLVDTWPGELAATRADALGLPRDDSFDAILRSYIAEEIEPSPRS